jgi:hypothetical protein
LPNAIAGSGQTLLFGIGHDDELAPPGRQFGDPIREVIRKCPRRRAHGLDRVGNQRGIDRVDVGRPAESAGELKCLAWVDDRHQQFALARIAATKPL